jgi:hypothetical protein
MLLHWFLSSMSVFQLLIPRMCMSPDIVSWFDLQYLLLKHIYPWLCYIWVCYIQQTVWRFSKSGFLWGWGCEPVPTPNLEDWGTSLSGISLKTSPVHGLSYQQLGCCYRFWVHWCTQALSPGKNKPQRRWLNYWGLYTPFMVVKSGKLWVGLTCDLDRENEVRACRILENCQDKIRMYEG